MTTLHIEHPITDFNAWLAGFDRFAQTRAKAGSSTDNAPALAGTPQTKLLQPARAGSSRR